MIYIVLYLGVGLAIYWIGDNQRVKRGKEMVDTFTSLLVVSLWPLMLLLTIFYIIKGETKC